jgi:putative addiction module killer protein
MTEVIRSTQFNSWFLSLRDSTAKARISARLDRLIAGNPGQYRNLTGGVSELKVDTGPGYRVYFTQRGKLLIILLCGGDKSSQATDIEDALRLAHCFKD